MRKLTELIGFLPYYFRDKDTYKDSNGKGLLEKYLEIFGNYFEDILVTDIKSLDGILDIDHTDSIYLGYLWEFLGQLPYANPQAVDPEKWKAYFNGFDDDATIDKLSKYWLYPKDTVSNNLVLSEGKVRQLLKYSVTLFKIRGTEKFFKTLLALYGVKVEILESQSSPITVGQHDDSADFYGERNENVDFYGSDDDFGGMVDYYRKENKVPKFDGDGAALDGSCTMDLTSACNTCASVHFALYIPSQLYQGATEPMLSFIKKIEEIIKRFLPVNVRAIFEWLTPDGTKYKVTNGKVLRPLVLVDTLPNYDYMPSYYDDSEADISDVFETLPDYPGWYVYMPDTLSNLRYRAIGVGTFTRVHIRLTELRWLIGTKIRVMVLMVPVDDYGNILEDTGDDELDPIRFTINDGDIEYESGHVFDFTIGASKTPISITPKPVLLDQNWRPWYTDNLPVIFHSLLNRVSYKFNIDYNSEVKVNFNYGESGIIPVISYKEVAAIVDGSIIGTSSSPVSFIWNNDVNSPIVPEPIPNDTTRYRAIVNPKTAGTQSFYMVENPSRIIEIDTTVNRLMTTVVASKKTLQLTDDNPTGTSRLDVRLGPSTASINLPDAPEQCISFGDPDFINNNFTKSEDRGLCKAYCSSKYVLENFNYNSLNRVVYMYLLVSANPVHNNSQILRFVCEGVVVAKDGTDDEVEATLITEVNLLTGTISYTEYSSGTKKTGRASTNGIISNRAHNGDVVFRSTRQGNYNLVEMSFTLALLVHGYGNKDVYGINPHYFEISAETLSYSDLMVFSTSNKDLRYNVGELAVFNHPGLYTFKAGYTNDPTFSLVTAYPDTVDVNGLFNSGIKYTLEIMDDDRTDNKANTIRMPYTFDLGSTQAKIPVNLNLFTNLDQVQGIDMETQFPNYFDWVVEIRWGSNPMGELLDSVELTDDGYNVIVDPYTGYERPAEHYGKTGTFDFKFNKDASGVRNYEPTLSNFPPGLYTLVMHSRSPMEGQEYYQVIELYESQDPNARQIHIDVDVISRAWLNPVGINGDINTNKTWGYYKSHLESMVTNASYDVHIEVPEFRVLLSNNNIGYKKVWLYKALPIGAGGYDKDDDMIIGNINYRDIIYGDDPGEQETPTKDPGTNRAWIFTGTVYDIGELVRGPEEPGSYMLVVHQTTADKVTIGKAYLEVEEIANYILRINPTAAVLEEEDTAVSTNIDVTNDAIWPKKLRLYSAFENKWVNLVGSGDMAQTIFPVTYLAYTAGIYNFKLYWWDEDHTGIDPTTGLESHWIPLSSTLGLLEGTFNVVRNTTLSPETRTWTWDGSNVILTVDLVMVSSESQIPWTATISEDQ